MSIAEFFADCRHVVEATKTLEGVDEYQIGDDSPRADVVHHPLVIRAVPLQASRLSPVGIHPDDLPGVTERLQAVPDLGLLLLWAAFVLQVGAHAQVDHDPIDQRRVKNRLQHSLIHELSSARSRWIS